MALIGNAFDDYVKEQIKTRQSALGEGVSSKFRNLETLQAFNSNTPWIRLASAIDVTAGNSNIAGESVQTTIENLGIFDGFDWKGDSLSKNFVLMGAPTNQTGTSSPKSIVQDQTTSLQGAYGFGYNQTDLAAGRGYVPPPGITSATFEYKNDGALAFATVNIKAFSDVQFSIIDILFQRPGYTCLLEFGHTMYLGNDKKLKIAGKDRSFDTKPFQFLYKGKGKDVNYTNLANKIAEEKRDWEGNYEGFFGRITKFNWKFNEDGSYDIVVKLTGTGDVISSLKINNPKLKKNATLSHASTTQVPTPTEAQLKEAAEEGGFLISEAIKSQLNWELYNIFNKTTTYPSTTLGSSNFGVSDITVNVPVSGNTETPITIKSGVVKSDVNDWGGTDYSPITLIKFGALLSIIQRVCNLKDVQGNTMLDFSMVQDLISGNDTTYMVTYPGNFSSNPTKCLIKYSKFDSNITKAKLTDTVLNTVYLHKSPEEIKDVENPYLVMRLSDVYVDLGFIAQTMKDLRGNDQESDNEVDISILDLLNSILSGINTSLGGINSFRVLYNEVTNQIDIISESPILNTKPEKANFSVLNTFGFNGSEGSFITGMDLNSELTDQFATQISIGAQANSTTLAGGASAFSTYSKGLVDRMFAQKISTTEEGGGDSETVEPKDKIVEIFNEDVETAFYQVYGDREYGDKYIPTLEGVVSNISNIIINRYTQKKQSPVPVFLPFNLSLTMQGLGGMKIYQAFQIDGKGLPISYNPKTISLVIKSLSHTIDENGWKTKVETLSKPLTDLNIVPPNIEESSLSPDSNNSSSPSGNSLPLSEATPPPSLDPTSEKRFNAMKNSYNFVFKNQGKKSGMCARWSYNLGYNYVKYLKNQTPLKSQLAAGGNANNNSEYYKNLQALGYSKTQSVVTKERLIELIKTTTWGYGDIIAYWCNNGPKGESHVKYGHTQIYVGSINSTKWATSVPLNYGGSFPYRNRKGNNWTYVVFRAPSN